MKQDYRITLNALNWYCILTVDTDRLNENELMDFLQKRPDCNELHKLNHFNTLHSYLQLMAVELFFLVAKAHGKIALADCIDWFRNRVDFLPADPDQYISIKSVGDITLTALNFWISKT